MLLNISTQSPDELESAIKAADAEAVTAVSMGHAVPLTEAAATQLARLTAVTTVDLSEVYLTPCQLRLILGLPKLRQLTIYGGTSWEFDGSLNVMPTLGNAHFEALAQSSPKSLELLELAYQDFDAQQIDALTAAWPDIEIRSTP